MILGDIGRRHEYGRFAEQLQFADAACSRTRHNKVGRTVCDIHISDELARLQGWIFFDETFDFRLGEILSCLPKQLHVSAAEAVD